MKVRIVFNNNNNEFVCKVTCKIYQIAYSITMKLVDPTLDKELLYIHNVNKKKLIVESDTRL
jgi:hypothetical protein